MKAFTAMVTIRKNQQYCFVLTNNHHAIFFSEQLLKNIQPFWWVKIKKIQSFQKCLCFCHQLWMTRKIFSNTTTMFICILLTLVMNNFRFWLIIKILILLIWIVVLKDIVKAFYAFMKEVAGVSNHNLVRNPNAYMSTGGAIDPEFKFSCIDNSYEEGQQKSHLGH